jgi:preprotein translocase subunit SecD
MVCGKKREAENLLMRKLMKNWKMVLLIVLLISSILLIMFKGPQMGIDFKGGTLFQIHLAQPVKDPRQIESITSTIEQRLDWTGLKDVKVSAWGSDVEGVEFIIAQMAETTPEEVEKIESILLKQGKFESMFEGEVMFSGDDILQIHKEVAKGYNYRPISEGQYYEWTLPFTLTADGAQKFTEKAFHQCSQVGYTQGQGVQYDCKKTYFFIDRPTEAVLVLPQLVYEQDKQLFLQGNVLEGIPEITSIDEVLLNAQTPQVLYQGQNLSAEDLNQLKELRSEKRIAIVPDIFEQDVRQDLEDLNYLVKVVAMEENIPWTWDASGCKTIISLSEEVTNDKPFINDFKDAKIFGSLVIRGFADDAPSAKAELDNLTILLESGSLPVPVDDISKETISPFLGKEFLFYAGLIGLLALIVVSIIIFVRYRVLSLTVPIAFTAISEVILVLGFATLINWNLDLAAITGIVAAVGTGVDDQIIITDELMRGEIVSRLSLVTRIKSAFFIVFAAAATTIATMSPIVLFGYGMGKLTGFAITTIAGVLIGVLITRPAYGEMVKVILQKLPSREEPSQAEENKA